MPQKRESEASCISFAQVWHLAVPAIPAQRCLHAARSDNKRHNVVHGNSATLPSLALQLRLRHGAQWRLLNGLTLATLLCLPACSLITHTYYIYIYLYQLLGLAN